MNVYSHFLLLLLGSGVILNSCEIDSKTESQYRLIAWNVLSPRQQDTVIGDWKTAKVRAETYREQVIWSVAFNTSHDPTFGPIIVFIEPRTSALNGNQLSPDD